jgi:hypothetical protein
MGNNDPYKKTAVYLVVFSGKCVVVDRVTENWDFLTVNQL